MDKQLKSNILSSKHWLRVVYMVFFAVCLQVARIVMWAVVGFQFLFVLLSGKDNPQLRVFGKSLTDYIFQALNFLTYNTEEKPFPFADWPKSQNLDDAETPLEGELEVAQTRPDNTQVIGENDAQEVSESEQDSFGESAASAEQDPTEMVVDDDMESKSKDSENLETDKV